MNDELDTDATFFALMEDVEIPPRPYEDKDLDWLIEAIYNKQKRLMEIGEMRTQFTPEGKTLRAELEELHEEKRIKGNML